jgi:hypothetical protein
MFKKSLLITSVLFVTGCSSLGVMDKTEFQETPNENTAIINIVRPNIFLGDGVKFEAWIGTTFIGTLKAGSMLQYAVTEGTHCVMVDTTQRGKWAVLPIEVKANSSYYVKPNTIPFVGFKLGLANDEDARKEVWAKKLKPYVINKNKTKPIPQKVIDKAAAYAADCI